MPRSRCLVAVLACLVASTAAAERFVHMLNANSVSRRIVEEIDPATDARIELWSEAFGSGVGATLDGTNAVLGEGRIAFIEFPDMGAPLGQLATVNLADGTIERLPLVHADGYTVTCMEYDEEEDRLLALLYVTEAPGGVEFAFCEVDRTTGALVEIGDRFVASIHQHLTALDAEDDRLYAIHQYSIQPGYDEALLLSWDTSTGLRLPDVTLPFDPDGCRVFDYRAVEFDAVRGKLIAMVWPCVGPTRFVTIDPADGTVEDIFSFPEGIGSPGYMAIDTCGRRVAFNQRPSTYVHDLDTGALLDEMDNVDEQMTWLAWDGPSEPCVFVPHFMPVFRSPAMPAGPRESTGRRRSR